MKKLLILSILVLFAVSVAAQYTAVLPKSIAVGVSDECYDVCKRDCVYVQKMTSEQCAKICGEKCQQSTQPAITRVQQPEQSCEASCREYATKPAMVSMTGSGFDMQLFIKCMHEKCRQDCESSCRAVYRAAAYDCIQKECRPQVSPPDTCGQDCKRKLDECLQTTVGINIESIRAACARLHDACMQESCGKPEQPPKTCEQGCDRKRDECLKTAVGLNIESIRAACEKIHRECMQEQCSKPESCEGQCAMDIRKKCMDRNLDEQTCALNVQACIRERCKPEKPGCPPKCEDKCVDGYYRCAKIAKTMKAQAGEPEAVQTDYLMRCQKGTVECLDNCRPEEIPEVPQRCEDRCMKLGAECQEAGIDAESCKMKVDECMRQCPPKGPQFEPGSAIAPPKLESEEREADVSVDEKPPSPKDLAGLNPQPEPPKPVGFWGRLWGSIFGD